MALGGTALVPIIARLLPTNSEGALSPGSIIPVEAIYGTVWEGMGRDPLAGGLSQAIDGALVWTWIAGSLAVLLSFSAATARLRRKAAPWPRAKVAGETVLISDGIGPAVLGLVRPQIVLPPWTLGLGPSELEMILLHEREHRKARDPALLAAGIAMVILAPWNPALWWGVVRLRLAVEVDCDRRVLALGVPRKKYGHLLLGVANGGRGSFPLAPALAEGGGSSLERRLRMMRIGVERNKVGGTVVATVLGSLFLALACDTPTPPQTLAMEEAQAGVLLKVVDGSRETPEEALIRESETPNGETRPFGAGVIRLRPVGEGSPDQGLEPLVYFDGVRIEGTEEALAGLNPDSIDRIEVIKGGAATAMFGEDAAGGVIHVFLKKQSGG